MTSNLDSTHSFLTFYRIDIDWRLDYDGFMTMYGFPSSQGDFRQMWLLGFPEMSGPPIFPFGYIGTQEYLCMICLSENGLFIYIYIYIYYLFIFSIFSIPHKTIVFPSPGAHTPATHHRLTCRYWIRVRINYIKFWIFIKFVFLINLHFWRNWAVWASPGCFTNLNGPG